MWIGNVDADRNGFILFAPDLLQEHYGGRIEEGRDLLTEYLTRDDGDEVLKRGLVLPVYNIDDYGYTVVVRLADEPAPHLGEVVVESDGFALASKGWVALADLDVLARWSEDQTGWSMVPLPPGFYAVKVVGFRKLTAKDVVAIGYEFVLTPRPELPAMTADLTRDLRLL